MRKLLLLAVVAIFSSTVASAQIVSSSSRSLSVTTKEKKESSGILYFAYESPAYKYEGNASDRYHGFAMGYTRNVALSSSIPFFFNWGVSANYYRDSNDYEDYKVSSNDLSFAIPLGLSYALPLSDNVSLVPAFGLNMRIGAISNTKYDYTDSDYGDDETYSFYDNEGANRFTVGIYTGGSFEFNTVSIGVYYITDFTPCMEEGSKYSAISLRLGFKL